jgi:hypothetical protein
VGVVAFQLAAHASTISLYDNSGLTGQSTSTSGVELAQSFTTGTDPIGPGTISFQYQNANDDPSMSSGSYTSELFASAEGAPSTLIATLASDVTVPTAGNTNFTYD